MASRDSKVVFKTRPMNETMELAIVHFVRTKLLHLLPRSIRKLIQSFMYEQLSNDTIKEAVSMWCAKRQQYTITMRYNHISYWDVSRVTNMSFLFYNQASFNDNLELWDVRNVINMSSMFAKARSFNQTLSSWQVSAVEDMSNMFNGADAFNQSLDSWDISNVKNSNCMFNEKLPLQEAISSFVKRKIRKLYKVTKKTIKIK